VARLQDPPEVLARFNDTLELVEIVARQVSRAIGAGIEFGDLLSFGREGLLEAARRYDPERGVPFRAYANFRVRGAIIDGIRVMGRLPRRAHERLRGLEAASRTSEGLLEDLHAPQAPGSGAINADRSLSDHLAAMATAIAVGLVSGPGVTEDGELVGVSAADPEAQTADAELRALLRGAIGDLPEQESELVRRHYLEGERFDAVAKDLGLSKSWASRLHTRAIGRLTKRLRGQVG
jgi:RNA polymerase sigma factor for flagellar operon FliA